MINVVFIIIYMLASLFFSGTDLYVLLTIHFAILLIMHLRQEKTVITPLLIYYVGVIIVNLGNISLISTLGSAHQGKTYNYIVPKFITDAALIWCISSTMFIIGYKFYSKKKFPSVAFDLKNKKVLQNIFYFLIIENILLILGSGIALRGSQVGKVFVLLNTIGILFYARLWAKNDNKTYRNYAIALYLIETYLALISSYLRFELILPTFYLFTGYFIGKGDIKYIFSYRIIPLAAIVIGFAIVFPSLQASRSNFISVFTQPADNKYKRVEKPEENESGGLLNRSANVAQITNVVKLVKRNGFYNGRASAPIITALIPRFLWPDKPLIQLGAWFALEIGVATTTDYGRANNSINMTVAGELFLDFGWLGVILGSLLFGGFISVLWNSTYFYSSEYNLTGIIFGGYLIMLSIGSYADLQIVVTLLSTYLIFFAIKKVASSL